LVKALREGGVGIIPSDTVYGVVCRAADKQAVERLYQIKPRKFKPGTTIAASVEQFAELGIPRRYLVAVEHLWPNPLSVVVPTGPGLEYLDHGKGSLPVRIPADEELLRLLKQTGVLQTTSANLPDEPPATTLKEAQTYFGDRVDFYVDGGDLSGRPPSTIIRVIDDEVVVLREGAVAFDENGKIVSK